MAMQPILIIEGQGDQSAVSYLIREVSAYGCFPASNPIRKQSIPRLSKPNELERIVGYALSREDGDSVLILLDTDEHCAKEVVENWVPRIRAMNPAKKVGIAFFVREFESLFLCCLDLIAGQYPEYGWKLEEWDVEEDHEAPRGAKQRLSRYMAKNKGYKETIDQPKFVSVLDFRRLGERTRSFQHLNDLLIWLKSANGDLIRPAVVDGG